MKKICFIVGEAVSFNLLCLEQLQFLKEDKSIHVTLVSGGDITDIKKLKSNNFGEFVYMPLTRRPSLIKDIYGLFRLTVFLIFNRFDLVVYSTPKALLIGSIASFFAVQRNRLAIIRGRVYENYTGIRRKLFTFLDWFSLLLSSRVIFISKSLAASCIEEKIISSDRCDLILNGSSNGVNLTRFTDFPDEHRSTWIQKKLGVRAGYFTVVIIGRVCGDKGAKELLELLKRLDDTPLDLNFIVVGRTEDCYGRDLVNYISQSNKSFYYDEVDDVAPFFDVADLHLFLTHREGFGNVAIEAAASGVPTFSYDVIGVKDSVCHGVSGLHFKYKDINGIYKEILTAAKDHAQFIKSFPMCREWASKNFDQSIVSKAYVDFFKDLCN